MSDARSYTSPEYTVLRTVGPGIDPDGGIEGGHADLSLALVVRGIPSFLATIPVEEEEVEAIVESLDRGKVRVSAVGISVDDPSLREDAGEASEPWRPEPESRPLPAAFLSLVCADGRRIGVARIVSRQASATPGEVARYVLRQIARGVQIPDLASTP